MLYVRKARLIPEEKYVVLLGALEEINGNSIIELVEMYNVYIGLGLHGASDCINDSSTSHSVDPVVICKKRKANSRRKVCSTIGRIRRESMKIQ